MTTSIPDARVDESGIRETDFLSIIRRYNEATERLRQSHDALGREVCRLRDELHEKDKELQRRERLAALGEMAAGVAHEIRNPLGAIRLYASLLERDLSDRPAQLDLVRRLEIGVRSLDGIVGDILAFAGEIEPRPGNVALTGVLDDVLAQTRPRADCRQIAIDVDDALTGVELYCDAAQVERALVNLVVNAIEAVGEGGHVWVQADGPAAWCDEALCHVLVVDDGPGIDPVHLQRVFNPFFTTKHTGTGLGLAIVHRIVEANGGFVRAENRAGGGAVFRLALPRAASRDGTAEPGRVILTRTKSVSAARI